MDFLKRINDIPRWAHTPLLDWGLANWFLSIEETVKYSFDDHEKWTLPVKPINGVWTEIRPSPSNNVKVINITTEEIESRHVTYQKAINKLRSAIISQAHAISELQFQKTVSILA